MKNKLKGIPVKNYAACGRCVYYRSTYSEIGEGQCRKYPPKKGFNNWPKVSENAGCGEYEERGNAT